MILDELQKNGELARLVAALLRLPTRRRIGIALLDTALAREAVLAAVAANVHAPVTACLIPDGERTMQQLRELRGVPACVFVCRPDTIGRLGELAACWQGVEAASNSLDLAGHVFLLCLSHAEYYRLREAVPDLASGPLGLFDFELRPGAARAQRRAWLEADEPVLRSDLGCLERVVRAVAVEAEADPALPSHLAYAHLRLAQLALRRRQAHAAVGELTRAQSAVPLACPPLEARLDETWGDALTLLGDYDGALARYRRALAGFEAQGDRARLAETSCGLGRVLLLTGDIAPAQAELERSLALAQADGRTAAGARAGLAWVALQLERGDPAQALAHAESALWAGMCLCDAALQASAARAAAQARLAAGDLQEAEQLIVHAYRLAERAQDDLEWAHVEYAAGQLLRRRGQPGSALAAFRRARRRYEVLDYRLGLAHSLHAESCVQLDLGSSREAQAQFRRALVIFEELKLASACARVQEGLAEAERRLAAAPPAGA